MNLKEDTVAALQVPLSFHGSGCGQRWKRFIRVAELELLRRIHGGDDATMEILDRRERYLRYYAGMEGMEAAKQLADDLWGQLEPLKLHKDEYIGYWRDSVVPWLTQCRTMVYAQVQQKLLEGAAERHRERVKDYNRRRNLLIKSGIKPGTPAWGKHFDRGRPQQTVARDGKGARRWKHRRKKFMASPAADDAVLSKLWNTIWQAAEEAGFNLP